MGIPKILNLLDCFTKCRIGNRMESSQCLLYQELQYQNEALVGLKTLEYGLNVHRVVNSHSFEPNFNIFYILLSGMSRQVKSSLHLQDAHHYTYLSCTMMPSFTELDFKSLRKSLKCIGLSQQDQMDLFKLLASLLHLGNLIFIDFKKQEPVHFKNPQLLQVISQLLGVSVINLENLLTFKTKMIQGEVCACVLNAQEAHDNRDLIVKCLYRLIVSWLLVKINDSYCVETVDTFIGLLDVPGMIVNGKKQNQFDHFLSNYVYERAKMNANQQSWIQCQAHSYKEGLCQDEGYCMENACLDVMNNGIFPLLSRQTVLAQSISNPNSLEIHDSFTDKIQERFSRNPVLKSCKLLKKGSSVKSVAFSLNHYKDEVVEYDFKDFCIQNADCMHSDLISILENHSTNPLFEYFFQDNVISVLKNSTSSTGKTESTSKMESIHYCIDLARRPSKSKSKFTRKNELELECENSTIQLNPHSLTLSKSLDELYDAIKDGMTWQILCLSHHPRGIHGKSWDSNHVKKQISRLDLMGLIRYQSLNPYITSYSYRIFVDKFKCLYRSNLSDANSAPRVHCQRFAIECHWEKKDIGFGRTEFFVSESLWNQLHEQLDKLIKKNVESIPFQDSFSDSFNDLDSDSNSELDMSIKSDIENPSSLSRAQHLQNIQREQKERKEREEDLESVDELDKKPTLSPARRKWLCCTWFLTWYIPVSFYL